MRLQYKGKASEKTIVDKTRPVKLKQVFPDGPLKSQNKLVKGGNLGVMKALMETDDLKGKVDLVYIDPPFSTNTVFRVSDDRGSTVSSSYGDGVAYEDTLNEGEFLEFIRKRLILLRELMSDKASIYLHIDYKIGHYIKVIMDEVFGSENFRNDITRIKCNPKNFQRKAYGNIKDLILFYSKTGKLIWNDPAQSKSEEDIERLFGKADKSGRKYTTTPLHAPGETRNGKTGKEWRGMLPPKGRHWRYQPEEIDRLDKEGLIEWSKSGNPRKIIYADETSESKMQDIWKFKDPQYPSYPTEKNLDLLKKIIEASSNQKSIVLDCFSGSGTTLIASEMLGRKWVGIDSSDKAIKITRERFRKLPGDLFSEEVAYNYLEEI